MKEIIDPRKLTEINLEANLSGSDQKAFHQESFLDDFVQELSSKGEPTELDSKGLMKEVLEQYDRVMIAPLFPIFHEKESKKAKLEEEKKQRRSKNKGGSK